VEHNIRGLGELSAPRSHLLLKVATSVGYVDKHKSKMKILSIGPRVEGEIINIIAYGFNPWNIKSIDLFTYSPFIGLGDMHSIDHPDCFFDVVLCGWVLGYSDNPSIAALEILRVLKPGGIAVVANAYSALDSNAVSSKLGYSIGASGPILSCSRLRQLFSTSSELDVFFEYDASLYGYDGDSMIIGIRKSFASAIDSK
jgi:SAM-dependent methyltransferase